MNILIVGGGNMGLTYAYSFLRSHIVTTEQMMILEKSPEKANIISQKEIGTVYGSPEECVEKADLLILAVKPQDKDNLFPLIKELVRDDQLFLSIMAGVKLKTISEGLDITKVVRAMPNLPAQIGMGMTAFTASPEVSRTELVKIQNLINTTGKSIYVETEDLIDAATAISGSGPAYVFFFMDAMMSAAEQLGFSSSQAELLTWQTFTGAVDLFQNHNKTCQEWISMVSSRGGTTEAAIQDFSKNKVKEKIIEGIQAAYDRANVLGGNKNEHD